MKHLSEKMIFLPKHPQLILVMIPMILANPVLAQDVAQNHTQQVQPPILETAKETMYQYVVDDHNIEKQIDEKWIEIDKSQIDNLDKPVATLTESVDTLDLSQQNSIVDQKINPEEDLPTYQATEEVETTIQTVKPKSPNILKRLYQRIFGGEEGVARIGISFVDKNGEKTIDDTQQPFANIKAGLEQVTVESIGDYQTTVSRLRQIAKESAEAVGYYEVVLNFQPQNNQQILVVVESVGEPVKVTSRVIDLRGEGAVGDKALSIYPAMEQSLPPQIGDVFHHGIYEQTKATIDNVAKNSGFFDGQWLNSSVDIILPDNKAEVDLIYDTKQRYRFGEVQFLSIDPQGNISDDPKKLPVKLSLLQKIMPYRQGDDYFQPLITQFSNNLLATGYFNAIDLDVVLPPDDQQAKGTVEFDNQTSTDNQPNQDDLQANAITDDQPTAEEDPLIQNADDFAPIEFSVDDGTKERLQAIKQKAKILLNAPENIQLAEEEVNKSNNPLVLLANQISQIAKKLDKKEDIPSLQNQTADDGIDKMTAEQVFAQKVVPTYVLLNANKPKEAQIGLGYESGKGLRATGKLKNNLVNRHGLQMGVNLLASQADQAIELTGTYPYRHPLNDKLSAAMAYEHQKVDDSNHNLEINTIRAGLTRQIKTETGWNRSYALRYRYDHLNNKGKYQPDDLPPPFNHRTTRFTQQALLLGYGVNRTVTDDTLNPTKGYSQNYSLEIASKHLLTDADMVKLRANLTALYSFGQKNRHQILASANLGYIYSNDFHQVPYKLRFFAGGDHSIRGYDSDSQGATMKKGDFLIGGNTLAVGSLEYNYQFLPNLRAALFSDVGNAYLLNDSHQNLIKNRTKIGVGAGIRWSSPIGVVRVDVATGIENRKNLFDKNNPLKFYLFIGSPL